MTQVTFTANGPWNLLLQQAGAWHNLCKNDNVYIKSTTGTTLVTEGVTSSLTHRWLGSVRLGRWTCDQAVMGWIPGWAAIK